MKITKKSITLLLAGLLCASNSFSQTYPKQDGVIRLLTYNTHYPVYVDIKIPGMSAIQQTTKNNLEIRLQLSDCELSVFSAEPINEIEIFSSNGCLIQRNQGENLQTTNIPQLPAGIYLVKVKSEEGYTVTKKILKR